jgi:3-hydroxybutyryl-CoA dehydrogenase
MGIGIAHRFAANGYDVHLVDVDLATAQAAVERVAATLRTAVERAKLTAAEGHAAISRLHAHGSIDDMPEGLELIIEAVIEDAALKGSILSAAQRRNPTTLASNTSSISIDQLATSLGDPTSFAGMHFFNPVWAMHLVEVVRGSATSDDTIARIVSIVQRLGMEHAIINDAPGFATSRLGVLVGLEAIRMVETGVASPVDIDTAMRLGYGHPMGPLMLGDLVGLDVRLGIAEHLATVYGSRFEPPDLLRTMVASGRLGKKSGLGFYDWSSGSAEPVEES